MFRPAAGSDRFQTDNPVRWKSLTQKDERWLLTSDLGSLVSYCYGELWLEGSLWARQNR